MSSSAGEPRRSWRRCGKGLAGLVDAALQHWLEPDQGIWEVGGDPKHFTASKVMCWARPLAPPGGAPANGPGDGGRAPMRSRPRCWTRACPAGGVFRQHYETDDLDASLLLPIMGFLPTPRRTRSIQLQ